MGDGEPSWETWELKCPSLNSHTTLLSLIFLSLTPTKTIFGLLEACLGKVDGTAISPRAELVSSLFSSCHRGIHTSLRFSSWISTPTGNRYLTLLPSATPSCIGWILAGFLTSIWVMSLGSFRTLHLRCWCDLTVINQRCLYS